MREMDDQEIFFTVINLRKEYQINPKIKNSKALERPAVNNVSFHLNNGECMAIVGESGSGKTTLGRCLLRLVKPDGGSVIYQGKDLLAIPEKHYRHYRRKFQMIFQDASLALNPRQTIASCLAEPIRLYEKCGKNELWKRVDDLLQLVHLDVEIKNRYPQQLSGGQRQRVSIARALAVKPKLLIADEPTSSLDASVKYKIIELLKHLQLKFKMTMVLISHDINLVLNMSDRIGVMYKGDLVEISNTNLAIHNLMHPYSRLLIESARFNKAYNDTKNDLDPSFLKSKGSQACSFSDRCPWTEMRCCHEKPLLRNIGNNHFVACHFAEKVAKEPKFSRNIKASEPVF